MGVDPDGNLVQLGAQEEVDVNDVSGMARMLRPSSGKVDENLISVRQHDDINASQYPEEGQERPICGRPPPKAGDEDMCRRGNCKFPTRFEVAIVGDNTVMESFRDDSEEPFMGFWPGDVTRTATDEHMVPQRDHCVCQGCDEWSEWAIRQLATPTSCDIPSAMWRLVWDVKNPESTKSQVVKFKVGRVLEVTNGVMHNLAYGDFLTKQVFYNADKYDKVAKAEEDNVWEDAHTIHQELKIEQGKTMAVYQYVLTCQLFNSVNMHINGLQFRLPHFIHRDDLRKPECNPNQDDGFEECHKKESQKYINAQNGKTEQADPTNEDVLDGSVFRD